VETLVTVGQLEFDKSKIEIADLEEDEAIVRLDSPQQEEVEEAAPETEADAIAKMEATAESKDEEEEEDSEKK
jgi:hypothetical protein